MAKENSTLRSENDLTGLAKSGLITDLFGSGDRLIQLYQSQIKCIQFGSLPIPRQHCVDTYNLILEFINDVPKNDAPNDIRERNTSLFSIGNDDAKAAPLTGLLHHVLQNDESATSNRRGEKASRFWHLLDAYNKIDR